MPVLSSHMKDHHKGALIWSLHGVFSGHNWVCVCCCCRNTLPYTHKSFLRQDTSRTLVLPYFLVFVLDTVIFIVSSSMMRIKVCIGVPDFHRSYTHFLRLSLSFRQTVPSALLHSVLLADVWWSRLKYRINPLQSLFLSTFTSWE